MEITSITPTDEEGKREIFVDGAPFLRMSAELIIKFDIHVGDTMDDARLEELTVRAEGERALQKAYTYLSYNALSRKTLGDKLRRAGFSDAAAELTLDRLEELELIDDERYAQRLFETIVRTRHWGSRKILFELKKRGVPDETAARFAAANDDRASAAEFFRHKYAGRDMRDPKERQRAVAGMSRNGFGYDDIRAVIAEQEDEL